MDELTRRIIKTRIAHSAAKTLHADAKEGLGFMEASLFLGCDYKGLGPNEATRKAAFRVNVLDANTDWKALYSQVLEYETAKDNAGIELETLLDQRRAYENALRAEFIKGRYGVIVAVERSDDYDEFELSVMSEEYFKTI